MILQQAISLISDAIRGIDDDAPIDGTDEWNYWVRVLNRKKNELYNDTTKNWSLSYDVKPAGTITAGTALSYPLANSFIAPSGSGGSSGIYVITTIGQRIDLDLVKPQNRSTAQSVFIGGNYPRELYFSNEIKSTDSIVGGTLSVSGYYMPDDLVSSTDILPFSDPYWGVLSTAAEIAGNDVTYEDKEANLTVKANALYTQMLNNEQRSVPGAPRVAKTSVRRIRGF